MQFQPAQHQNQQAAYDYNNSFQMQQQQRVMTPSHQMHQQMANTFQQQSSHNNQQQQKLMFSAPRGHHQNNSGLIGNPAMPQQPDRQQRGRYDILQNRAQSRPNLDRQTMQGPVGAAANQKQRAVSSSKRQQSISRAAQQVNGQPLIPLAQRGQSSTRHQTVKKQQHIPATAGASVQKSKYVLDHVFNNGNGAIGNYMQATGAPVGVLTPSSVTNQQQVANQQNKQGFLNKQIQIKKKKGSRAGQHGAMQVVYPQPPSLGIGMPMSPQATATSGAMKLVDFHGAQQVLTPQNGVKSNQMPPKANSRTLSNQAQIMSRGGGAVSGSNSRATIQASGNRAQQRPGGTDNFSTLNSFKTIQPSAESSYMASQQRRTTLPYGRVDVMTPQMSKEEAQHLIFSNSNAIIEGQEAMTGMTPGGTMAQQSIRIADNNYHLLVDQNIATAPRTQAPSVEAIAGRVIGDFMPRHDTGGAIHVNDQSIDQAEHGGDQEADDAVFEMKRNQRRLIKQSSNNVEEGTATDDMAASSETINESAAGTGVASRGALVVASATSECSNASIPVGHKQDHRRQRQQRSEIQIVTGEYSLNQPANGAFVRTEQQSKMYEDTYNSGNLMQPSIGSSSQADRASNKNQSRNHAGQRKGTRNQSGTASRSNPRNGSNGMPRQKAAPVTTNNQLYLGGNQVQGVQQPAYSTVGGYQSLMSAAAKAGKTSSAMRTGPGNMGYGAYGTQAAIGNFMSGPGQIITGGGSTIDGQRAPPNQVSQLQHNNFLGPQSNGVQQAGQVVQRAGSNAQMMQAQAAQAANARGQKSKSDMRRITSLSPSAQARPAGHGMQNQTGQPQGAPRGKNVQLWQYGAAGSQVGAQTPSANQGQMIDMASYDGHVQTPQNAAVYNQRFANAAQVKQGTRGASQKGRAPGGNDQGQFQTIGAPNSTAYQTIGSGQAGPGGAITYGGAAGKNNQSGYFYQKRQTQFQTRGGMPGVLSENTLTPDVPALPDFHIQGQNGITTGGQSTEAITGTATGSKRANSNTRATNATKAYAHAGAANQGVVGANTAATRHAKSQNTKGGKFAGAPQSNQVLDNYTDNRIGEAAGGPRIQLKQRGANVGVPPSGKNGGRAISTIRRNIQGGGGQISPSAQYADGRPQMLSALQNPIGPLSGPGQQAASGADQGTPSLQLNFVHSEQASNEGRSGPQSPDKQWQTVGVSDAQLVGAQPQRNALFSRVGERNKPGNARLVPGGRGKAFEGKKLSQSFVVYHQMKKNLMQSNGFARGSRYYPPGVAGGNRVEAPPLSEENLEEQLNSLLLDTTVDAVPAGQLSVEGKSGLNALEQALQDHLNREKAYENSPSPAGGLSEDNYAKYHLRPLKNTGGAEGLSQEHNTTAANSSAGNYINFRARKLALKNRGADQQMVNSAEDAEDPKERQRRLEISGILCASLNDYSSLAIAANRAQVNKTGMDTDNAAATKLSNQNALLSLLSQDDFKALKNQIHGRMTATEQALYDDMQEQDEHDGARQTAGTAGKAGGGGTDMDALSQGVLSQGEELN